MRIKRDDFGSSKMRFLADNTKYAYYGKKITSHEICTLGMPGTRYCRMIQGHALNGCGMTLFNNFYAVEKGKYHAAPLGPSVDWLKWCGFNISYALIDREFYRVMAIRDLRKRGIPVIIPAKKFGRVKNEFVKYLRNQRQITE